MIMIDHLCNSLVRSGIKTFRHDPELDRGSGINAENLESSSIPVVVILSQNYATSSWCLDQPETILNAKDGRKQVIPIFYNVDPHDVRYQTGRLAEQFKKLEESTDPEKVKGWKAVLTEVSNIAGWSSKDRSESDLINDIVKDVWQKLHPAGLPFPSPSQVAAVNKIQSTQYSSSSSHHIKKCDVFINFRGKDIRSNFFSHLCKALGDYGISTYRDDTHLQRGKSIASELVQAINEAKICLVILSPDFASSPWCLDELSQILPRGNGTLESFGQHEGVCWDNTEKVEKSMPTFTDAAMCNRGDSSQVIQLRLLVNYNGKWTNAGYTGGNTKGILVSEDITYGELEDRAYRIVGVDAKEYKVTMKAKYESKNPTQPVEIIDDDDLRFFIQENLSVDESSRTPLCITVEPQKDGRRCWRIDCCLLRSAWTSILNCHVI